MYSDFILILHTVTKPLNESEVSDRDQKLVHTITVYVTTFASHNIVHSSHAFAQWTDH